MRTAGITAIAVRRLARPEMASVACVGCGPIARMQLWTLFDQFPLLASAHLFDVNRDAAERLAAELDACGASGAVVESSAEVAVGKGDVVITCTTAERPYLAYEWLRPGALVANVSLMDVDKDVFLRADKLVVDDWDQCNREGKTIHELVREGRLARADLHAELGDIVADRRPGREHDEEVILLNPMGMAIADLACAQAVYHAALHDGVGTWLSLG
jgi:ornithine cyclodeaminase